LITNTLDKFVLGMKMGQFSLGQMAWGLGQNARRTKTGERRKENEEQK